eukprot:14820902-Heterocapsa_arctica.AAC.1
MMSDNSGTRANKLMRDSLFVQGALHGLTGTKIEIFTKILTTDKNVFRSVGPYTRPQEPIQQRWPEDE